MGEFRINVAMLLCGTAALLHSPRQAVAQPVEAQPTDIIVTAPRSVGPQPTDRELDANGIAAYGADDVGDLLDVLALGDDGSGEGPVILINGELASGIDEIADLPTEAVERVQLLARDAAAAIGQRPTRRVLNVVIKSNHIQATLLGKTRRRTGKGDAASGSGEVNLLKLRNGNRRSFVVQGEVGGRLLESERGLERGLATNDDGDTRTLLPRREEWSVNGTLLQKFDRHSVSVTGRGQRGENRSLFGRTPVNLILAPPSPFVVGGVAERLAVAIGDAREQQTRSTQVNIGIVANGPMARNWRYSLTAGFDHRRSESLADRGVDPTLFVAAVSAGTVDPRQSVSASLLSPLGTDRSRGRLTNSSAQLSVNGPLFALPAGQARLAGRVEWRAQRGRSRPNDAAPEQTLKRDAAAAHATLLLPIVASHKLGALSGELSGAVRWTTGSDRLFDRGAALNWTPGQRWTVRLAWHREQIAPPVGVLGDSLVLLDGVRTFDFVRGETVVVRSLSGGNPELDAEQRRTLALGVTASPVDNFDLTADLRSVRSSAAFGALPPVTAEVEQAFPDRFIRDGGGRLIFVDLRPVGFSSVRRDELRLGANYVRALGSRSGSSDQLTAGTRLTAFVQHVWTLRSTRRARPGLMQVDLLDGGAIGYAGGQSRHQVDFGVGIIRNGIGLQLSGTVNGRSKVVIGSLAAPDTLSFAARSVIGAKLFANLGPLLPGQRWATHARIALEADNLFDARPRVRNGAGVTPDGYQPALLDPLGRTIGLSLRKAF